MHAHLCIRGLRVGLLQTAAHEASNQNDCLKELVIKLQRPHKRFHSRYSSAETPTGPDLEMYQLANSVDESYQLPNTDHPKDALACENREPVSSSTVTPAWISRARLHHNMALTAQCKLSSV
jgi:hypothetical protein